MHDNNVEYGVQFTPGKLDNHAALSNFTPGKLDNHAWLSNLPGVKLDNTAWLSNLPGVNWTTFASYATCPMSTKVCYASVPCTTYHQSLITLFTHHTYHGSTSPLELPSITHRHSLPTIECYSPLPTHALSTIIACSTYQVRYWQC